MDLITTPASHKNNSYLTLTQAETYLDSYGRVDASWDDLSENQKKLALALAANALNTFKYRGKPVTITQKLAFPRFTWYQINKEGKTQYKSFFWATRSEELTSIISSGDIKVENNKLVDVSSSADGFYSPYYYGDIDINQIIKVTGLSTDTYLTVKDIDSDGEWMEIKEDITDESAPSGGVDVEATPLFGFPDEVGYAQAELAYQVINTDIFQADIGELPDPLPESFDLGGTLSVRYGSRIFGTSKYSKDQTSPLDIVYHLLGSWISSVGGGVV
jgi:hypothetical protein